MNESNSELTGLAGSSSLKTSIISHTTKNNDREDSLQLSARNQLRAKVLSVKHGGVLSTVKLELEPGQTMTATITREATNALALAPGTAVLGLCKATDVLVARNEMR